MNRVCLMCGGATALARCPNDGVPTITLTSGGHAAGDADDTLVGTVLGEKYRLTARLGEGGMGTVYRAVQLGMDREVAVKILMHHRQSPEDLHRFYREMKTTAQLVHPHCIRVHDFGHTPMPGWNAVYFVMELVRGPTLEALLTAEGALAAPRVVKIARQIALALGEAHALGLVHRDLKPDNVMLTAVYGDPEFVRVLDFGIARAVGGGGANETLTQTGAFIGTPLYASPEQARGEVVDQRADLYSFGVILYAMLAGRPPLLAESAVQVLMKHMDERPLPLAAALAERGLAAAPEALTRLVDGLLEKAPEARPQPVTEVVRILDDVARMLHGAGGVPFAAGAESAGAEVPRWAPTVRADAVAATRPAAPDPSGSTAHSGSGLGLASAKETIGDRVTRKFGVGLRGGAFGAVIVVAIALTQVPSGAPKRGAGTDAAGSAQVRDAASQVHAGDSAALDAAVRAGRWHEAKRTADRLAAESPALAERAAALDAGWRGLSGCRGAKDRTAPRGALAERGVIRAARDEAARLGAPAALVSAIDACLADLPGR